MFNTSSGALDELKDWKFRAVIFCFLNRVYTSNYCHFGFNYLLRHAQLTTPIPRQQGIVDTKVCTALIVNNYFYDIPCKWGTLILTNQKLWGW